MSNIPKRKKVTSGYIWEKKHIASQRNQIALTQKFCSDSSIPVPESLRNSGDSLCQFSGGTWEIAISTKRCAHPTEAAIKPTMSGHRNMVGPRPSTAP